MTQREVERLAKVEEKQDNMSDSINEIKSDIKEIKHMLSNVEKNYVTKKAAQWIVGTIISVSTAAIYLWDIIRNSHK